MNTHLTPATDLDEERMICATAMDYMEGWNTADAQGMERALHPDLAKRAYLPGPDGKPRFLHSSALALLQATRVPKDGNRKAEVRILDRFEGVASVRATMTEWVDYMHMVKVDGEWKIINILGEFTPEKWAARGGIPGERTR